MKPRTLLRSLPMIAVFAALAIPAPLTAQKQALYTVTFVGNFGGSFSSANGLNNGGSVAGQSHLVGDTSLHAFVWQKGLLTDLDTLGGPNSEASEGPMINNRDEVVGFSDTVTEDPNGEDFCGFQTFLICRPFVWKKGVMMPLPTLGGNNAEASGINNRGDIGGQAETPNLDPCSPFFQQVEAVIWRDGQIQQVLPPLGGSVGVVTAINDNGQAVGIAGCITGGLHAVLWQHGTPIDLGNLGAQAINSKGQVVGYADDFNGNTVALLWQNGVMTDLNTLVPGGGRIQRSCHRRS